MISSGMNVSMTVLGFAVSVLFIMFVCMRLLCARLQFRDSITRRIESSLFRRGFGSFEGGFNGVERLVMDTFPIIKYNREVFASREDAVCTVCLGDYEEKDILRVLPTCGHTFHINCIDIWLQQHSTCPVCRLSVRSSYDGGIILSPFLNIATQSRHGPRATTSENLSEHSCDHSFDSNQNQFGVRVHGQEHTVISFPSEQNQCRGDFHEMDEFNNERQQISYHVTKNSHEARDLSGTQLDDAMNYHSRFVSQEFAQTMIDKMPRMHRPCEVSENRSLAIDNPAAVQECQESVAIQINSNESTGIESSSEGEQKKNIVSTEQVAEISDGLDKSQKDLIAPDIIATDMPLNVDGRKRRDTDNSGTADRLENKSVFSHTQYEKHIHQRNVDF